MFFAQSASALSALTPYRALAASFAPLSIFLSLLRCDFSLRQEASGIYWGTHTRRKPRAKKRSDGVTLKRSDTRQSSAS